MSVITMWKVLARSLESRSRCFHLKIVHFQNRFEGQQDREFVIYQKNATFHGGKLQSAKAIRVTGGLYRLIGSYLNWPSFERVSIH
jgi:hypothetical protein